MKKKGNFKKRKKALISLLFMLSTFYSYNMYSQNGFQKVYGGSGLDLARSVLIAPNGDFIMVGNTSSFGAGNSDVYVIRADKFGDVIWSKTYGGTNQEYGYDVVLSPSNELIVGGETYSFVGGTGGEDNYLLNIDYNSGALNWSKHHGTSDNEYIRALILDDTNLVMTGYSNGGGRANDFQLYKTNLQGNAIVKKLYGTYSNEFPHGIKIAQGGNGYIINGYRRGFGASDSTAYILRVDASGNFLWSKEYDDANSTYDHIQNVCPTSDGGYIMVGASNDSLGAGGHDVLVIKTDAFGVISWQKLYGGTNHEDGSDIIQTTDGGFLVLGQTRSYGNGKYDVFLMKLASDGSFQWAKAYGGTEDEGGGGWQNYLRTNGTGYSFLSTTYSFGTNGDFYLVKVDANGNSGCNEKDFTFTVNAHNLSVDTIVPDISDFGLTDTANTEVNQPNTIEQALCEPCFAELDSNFTWHNSNETITSDEVWTGKHYIGPNVTVSVSNGVTLDLTNVDIVFDECAQIYFNRDSRIRANNSVFRTCDLTSSWKGLSFDNSNSGVINECVFKNAQIALDFYFEDATPNNIKVTNNLFSNNKIAIRASKINGFNNAITGNKFLIDDPNIDFSGTCSTALPVNEFRGIDAYNSTFKGLISQNEFINSLDSIGSIEFYGIRFSNCSGTMSKNIFTDLYRSIDVYGSSDTVNIENNEIEITYNYSTSHQIRITDASDILVSGNEIKNVNESTGASSYTNSAIYGQEINGLKIKENTIEGFEIGIQIIDAGEGIFILDNSISNANKVGVYVEDGDMVDIACNTINMNLFNESGDVYGIIYKQYDPEQRDIKIRSNCIFETSTAIYTWFADAEIQIPLIRNNYLYNYTMYGIYNVNFTGNIGDSDANSAEAGKNTFVSNNYPNGATDIESVGPTLNEAGNFFLGVARLVNVNPTGGWNLYNSTTSCGHQIDFYEESREPLSTIEEYEICDNSSLYYSMFFVRKGREDVLADNYLSALENISSEHRLEFINAMMDKLDDNTDYSQIDKLYNEVSASGLLGADEKKWLSFYHQYHKKEYNNAHALLKTMNFNEVDENELVQIKSIQLDLITNNRGIADLSNNEISMLKQIDDRSGKYAALARDVVHAGVGGHDYLFKKVNLPSLKKPNGASKFDDNMFTVYPNPTTGDIKVFYYLDDINQASFNVYNMQGQLIYTESLNFKGGVATLDCSDLSKGVYMITISNDDKVLKQSKLIKL